MVAEIALHAKGLRALHLAVPFDIARTASIRIQRMFRRVRGIRFSPRAHTLNVGDRVLYRPPVTSALLQGCAIYATAEGEIMPRTWKIRLVDGTHQHVQTHRVYRLGDWASRTSPVSKAVSHAASASREAALLAAQTALAVLQSPSTAAGGQTMQLALAAASTASTAATAATAAASALDAASPHGSTNEYESPGLAPPPSESDAHTAMTEAHGILEAHERLMEASGLRRPASHSVRAQEKVQEAMADAYEMLAAREQELVDAASPGHEGTGEALTARATRDLLRHATAAAATASAEAAVATHAASTVCNLPVTSRAATTATTVANNLVAASDALASDGTAAQMCDHRRVAVDAIGAIGEAQQRLTSACAATLPAHVASQTASSCSTSQTQSEVFCTTQRAALGLANAAAVSAAAANADLKPDVKKRLATDLRAVAPATCEAVSKIGDLANIDELLRDGTSSVLWCWLPRSSRWTTSELLERTTRAVAACRAHDFVALPDLPQARELVNHWFATDYGYDGLRPASVLWFDAEPVGDDPAFAALTSILQRFRVCDATTDRSVALYCMYPDARVARLAATHGLRCLGDLDAHPIVGSLRQAKSFLHPSLAQHSRPSLRDAALGDLVRGPRGYCCTTPEQLLEAWERLTTAHPGIKLVLKPASGSGGTGVVLDATKDDVESLVEQMRAERKGRFVVRAACDDADETIVEEMLGQPGKPSPTVYMVGSRVAVVADQLLTPCGTVNLGNVSPATQIDASVVCKMARACTELGQYLGLAGQWGADFVLDAQGNPRVVDLNMGRPNGSLSYYCWRARQLAPKTLPRAAAPATLALAASTYFMPEGGGLASLADSLKSRGLLWDSDRGDGIVLAQFLPGSNDGGSVLAASWQGAKEAQRILDAFCAHVKSHQPGDLA